MAATTLAFEAELQAGVVTRNLVPNPSGESGTPTVWIFTGSSGGQPTSTCVDSLAWARVGTHSSRLTIVRDDASTVGARTQTGITGIPVTPGRWYAARVTQRLVSMTPGGGNPQTQRGLIYWFTAAGAAASVPSTPGPNPAGAGTAVVGRVVDCYVIAQAPPDAAYASVSANYSIGTAVVGQQIVSDYDAFMLLDLGTDQPPSNGTATQPGDVPVYTEGATALTNPARGLMAGAAFRLRRLYLDGVADPAAHTLAKSNAKQVKALVDNAKMASFDAITAP